MDDFLHLFVGDKKVSDTLYRVGGMGGKQEGKYTMLLKHVEALYEKNITIATKKKPTIANRRHLASHWCIIDEQGKEVKVFKEFEGNKAYLRGGVVYSMYSDKFFNILTDELIIESRGDKIYAEDFILLESKYGEAERGIFKLNKADGSLEKLAEEKKYNSKDLPITLEDGTLESKAQETAADIFNAMNKVFGRYMNRMGLDFRMYYTPSNPEGRKK